MSGPYAEVIGDPIAHSKSPIIHGFWLDRLEIDARYERCHVTAEGLAAYFAARRADPHWRGCNVTLPHKLAVIPFLDRIDPVAERIGAVNTILCEGGRLIGHNSDAPGFLEPLGALLAQRHLWRTARILGTGGAARAIAHALWDEGFTLVIAGRDVAKAEALCRELGTKDLHAASLAAFAEPVAFDWGETGDDRLDLLVNATTLGMVGHPPLDIDFSNVPPGSIVYDVVYAPLETALLRTARASGHVALDGLEMLVGQARIAFRLFFGTEPPRDGDAALRALLAQ